MRRLIDYLLLVIVSFVLFGCGNQTPNEQMGKSKISGICRGEQIFYKRNGRYGTFQELLNADLADSDFAREWGYKSEVKLTQSGFLATVVPNDFTKAKMFYVDETRIIKKHSGDTNIKPDDSVCELEEGCFCFGD